MPSTVLSRRIRYRLYVSHLLTTWNSRLFEFAATLFIVDIYPGTLLPISVYALVRGISAIILSPALGSWIDKGDRLTVVRTSIIAQRLAVAWSCLIFWLMSARMGRLREDSGHLKQFVFAITIVLACTEKLGYTANAVVVITEGNEDSRQILNAQLRRIDLCCTLLGPLVASLINAASVIVAIWVTFGMSVLSMALEYIFIAKVYHLVPALAQHTPPDVGAIELEQFSEEAPPGQPPSRSATARLKGYTMTTLHRILPLEHLPFYFSHQAFLPSFSLALLYLTVLSLSGQMVTFLLITGYNSLHIGLTRTISTVVELSATWAAPRLARKIGLVRGGLWFSSWQVLLLAGGTCFFFADGAGEEGGKSQRLRAVSALVGGTILSRVGLWGFDLCVQSVVQNSVQMSYRGAFSTVEAAFQNLFEVFSYITTIIFSRPNQFKWPVTISVVATFTAWALFAGHVKKQRGHLLHFSTCLARRSVE